MKTIVVFTFFLSCVAVSGAVSTESAISAAELKKGCEEAIRMSQGHSLKPEEREAGIRAISYIDGFVEALTLVQATTPGTRLIHVPEDGRLRITYVQAVLATISADTRLESEGTARVAVMIALRKNYSP